MVESKLNENGYSGFPKILNNVVEGVTGTTLIKDKGPFLSLATQVCHTIGFNFKAMGLVAKNPILDFIAEIQKLMCTSIIWIL